MHDNSSFQTRPYSRDHIVQSSNGQIARDDNIIRSDKGLRRRDLKAEGCEKSTTVTRWIMDPSPMLD